MTVGRNLLAGAVDYAGMFPPACVDLASVIRSYCSYLQSADAWALGSLVLPAGSLAGFRALAPASATEWKLSVILGQEWENDLRLAEQLGFYPQSVELKPVTISQIEAVRARLPEGTRIFFELSPHIEADEMLTAVARVGAFAKIRTGGIVASAIPSAAKLIRLLVCCVQHGVACKATAGLHHALRAVHALSSDGAAERAILHGFVNVILAGALLFDGGDAALAVMLIGDESPSNFSITEGGLGWRDHVFSAETLDRVRQRFLLGFGSCSFTEPIAELKQMRWL